MNYEKLTPEKFNEKLKAGSYESLTGSRRAIGKADWSDAEKEKARERAAKHFGDDGGSKPAAKKEKAAAAPKKAAAKTAAKTEGAKRGRKPAVKEEVVGGQAEAQAIPSAHVEALRQTKALTITDVRKNPFQTIQLAEHGVKSATDVINALTALKAKDPSIEIEPTYNAAVNALQSSLNLTALVVQNLSEGLGGKAVALPVVIHEKEDTEEEHTSLNGATEASPVPGSTTYVAPSPEA